MESKLDVMLCLTGILSRQLLVSAMSCRALSLSVIIVVNWSRDKPLDVELDWSGKDIPSFGISTSTKTWQHRSANKLFLLLTDNAYH